MMPSFTTSELQGPARIVFDWLKAEQKRSGQQVVVMLAGRTGTGKSSTVNSLLGRSVAPVGDWEPTTREVSSHRAAIDGIPYLLVDTPGLCDDLDEDVDAGYLAMMRDAVPEIHTLLFVSQLDQTRITSDEKRGIRAITEAFGAGIWDHAVIVFTCADKVEPDRFAEAVRERGRLVRSEIAKAAGAAADAIPVVPVSNVSKLLPDGTPWLGELYTRILVRMHSVAMSAFVLSTAGRLRPGADGERPIALDREQKEAARQHVSSTLVATFTAAGSAIGGIFGPVGASIGGAIGAAVGTFVSWLFD